MNWQNWTKNYTHLLLWEKDRRTQNGIECDVATRQQFKYRFSNIDFWIDLQKQKNTNQTKPNKNKQNQTKKAKLCIDIV